MNTGEMIRKKRKALHISQGELGKKIALSTTTVSEYERGLYAPAPEVLVKIAHALQCPVEEIAAKEDIERIKNVLGILKTLSHNGTTSEGNNIYIGKQEPAKDIMEDMTQAHEKHKELENQISQNISKMTLTCKRSIKEYTDFLLQNPENCQQQIDLHAYAYFPQRNAKT